MTAARAWRARRPVEGSESQPDVRAYAYVVVVILMLCATLSFMDRTLLSLVVDPIKRDFDLSETQIGLLTGFAFSIFYSVMGLPLGRVADIGNRRWLIVAGVLGWSLATVACAMAVGFWSLFAARALVGIGEAALAPAAYSLIANYFPRTRLAVALSLFATGVTLGNGAAISLDGLIVRWAQHVSIGSVAGIPLTGWRLAFIVVAMFGLPLALLTLLVKEPAREADSASPDHPSFRAVLAYIAANGRAFTGVYLGYPLVVVMSFAQLFWGAAYFTRVHGMAVAQFGLIYGLVMGLGGTAGLLFGGFWSDRLWRAGVLDAPMRVILVSVLLQTPLMIGAFLSGDRTIALTLFSLAIVVLCMNGGLQSATLQILSPDRMRGRISAIYLILANLVGAGLGPLATGLMTEHLFGGPRGLGRSLALLAVLTLPLAAITLWLSMKAVRITAQGLLPAPDVRPYRGSAPVRRLVANSGAAASEPEGCHRP